MDYDEFEGSAPSRRRGGLPPFLRASLIFVLGMTGLQLVNVLTFGVSLVVFYPIAMLLYLGNGAMAAHFAHSDGRMYSPLGQGVLAGVVLATVEWIVYALLITVFGVMTIGVAWFGVLTCVVCGPGDILVAAGLGFVGAWAAKALSGGRRDSPTSEL